MEFELPEESDEKGGGLSTEQQVQEALQKSSTHDAQVQWRPCDMIEDQLVAQFALEGCGCGKECSSHFTVNYIRDI